MLIADLALIFADAPASATLGDRPAEDLASPGPAVPNSSPIADPVPMPDADSDPEPDEEWGVDDMRRAIEASGLLLPGLLSPRPWGDSAGGRGRRG